MRTGILYYEPPTIPFEARVRKVIREYITKMGLKPTTIYVHPSTLPPEYVVSQNEKIIFDGVALSVSRSTLPNHYFVGVENE